MFEKASRLKLRFPYKGLCTVEDLWDIPLCDLDNMFKCLNKIFKQSNEESLIQNNTVEDDRVKLSIDIIKHIVKTLLKEKEDAQSKSEKEMRKQKILSIISDKQDESLINKSIEELSELIDGL